MGVRYVQATVDEIIPAIQGMIPRDVAEMVPFEVDLDPDYELYRTIERVGKFRGFLALDGDKAVGYAWYFTNRHPHFKGHFWAVIDDYWLDPAYRRGRIAKRFFEFAETRIIATTPGLTGIMTASREGHPAARRLFESMGYLPLDTRLLKILEKRHA